jgi:P27 family predicted phage terminase small subunit
MTRGRKPVPTAQKRMRGNPGRRPLNEAEPQHAIPGVMFDQPPAELTDHAAAVAEWQRLAPLLRRARQVTEADWSALVALCLEWARYLEATKLIKVAGLVVRSPAGYPMPNPYLSIATRALANCNRLWPELGLTPSSRARVQVLPGGGGLGPDDPFSEFDYPAVDDDADLKPH